MRPDPYIGLLQDAAATHLGPGHATTSAAEVREGERDYVLRLDASDHVVTVRDRFRDAECFAGHRWRALIRAMGTLIHGAPRVLIDVGDIDSAGFTRFR